MRLQCLPARVDNYIWVLHDDAGRALLIEAVLPLLAIELELETLEGQGGYAREMTEDRAARQRELLTPILGIDDPRTNDRVAFVGGIRGTDELERLVDSGDYRVAFSMFPTSIENLFAVSDMGEVMPPKSTWFEPKLKDGLFVHRI